MENYIKLDLLKEFLYMDTKGERWHIENPNQLSLIYKNLPKKTINDKQYYYFDFSKTIKDHLIAIIKESRYTTVPKHINKDMQLYYVYDGNCSCEVEKEIIYMEKGDLILFDNNTIHAFPVKKKENDIIINIIFKKEYFNSIFLSRFTGNNMITNFLFDSVSNQRKKDKYLFFHSHNIPQIYVLIQYLLCNYFFPESTNTGILDSYITTILQELINSLYNDDFYQNLDNRSKKCLEIMEYIEINYKICTLNSTAKHFGYNQNYLSNLLKKETGKTYSEIKSLQQLSEAAFLLSNTNKPVIEIIDKVGISNYNFFYKKFKDIYSCTPSQYKKTMKRK